MQTRPEIIAVVNQKGGVGKTTTAVNLATALAAINKRVLIIDLDPQGNASTGFGYTADKRSHTIYDAIIGKVPFEEAVQKTNIPHLDLVPTTMDLSALEIELVGVKEREFVMKKLLAEHMQQYDYIFIDCPPSLGLLTINALVAANSMLVPLQCEFFALEGLSHLFKTYTLVKKQLNTDLKVKGIILTMYDRRNRLTEQVEKEVRSYFEDWVFSTVIPRNVRVSEAPSHGKPAIIYDYKCTGAKAYLLLAREMLQKEKMKVGEAA